jgi:hypothetical protein
LGLGHPEQTPRPAPTPLKPNVESKSDKKAGGGFSLFSGKKKKEETPRSAPPPVKADVEQGRARGSPLKAQRFSNERYEVGEDLYGLILVSPVCSISFLYALIVILMKYALFAFLGVDMYQQNVEDSSNLFSEKKALFRGAQFILLPIAIGFQEDLIYVYTRIASIKYDLNVKRDAPDSTRGKFVLSFTLRLIGGLCSLAINLVLILTSDKVIALFLNFAALQFLQSIDATFYRIAKEGFWGNALKNRCKVAEITTMARRGNFFTTTLHNILFLVTYAGMLGVWIYVCFYEKTVEGNM